MAARTRVIFQNEATRRRIQGTMIVNRLQAHIRGEIEMTASQVTAGLGLLKKIVPDLMQAEYRAEVKHAFVRLPEVMPQDLWLQRRGQPVVEGQASSPTYDPKVTPDAPTTLDRSEPPDDTKLN
jgi:hypothetical protein